MNKPCILIIETVLSGHRGEYVRWIVQGFLNKKYKVILALPESELGHQSICELQHENFSFKSFEDDLLVEKIKWLTKFKLISKDYMHYRLFKEVFNRVNIHENVENVFIPFIDHALYSFSVFGSPFKKCRFSGISMRPDFHYTKIGVNAPERKGANIKEWLFNRFLQIPTLRSLFTLDEALAQYYKNTKYKKLIFLPEPADFIKPVEGVIEKIKQELGIPSLIKTILVYGSLTSRKGIIILLKTLLKFDSNYNFQVVLAGKTDGCVNKELQKKEYISLLENKRLIVIDRFISSEEESVLFSIAYCCWLGYIGHFRASGVLIQSCKYNLPVLATNEGIIGWQVHKHNVGLPMNSSLIDSVYVAMKKMLSNNTDYQHYKNNTKNAFVENTLKNAQQIIVESI
ncbi:MAG: glycosyltransferase [Bacteroidota bacterium]